MALGGFANSSAVVIWAVICPLGTLVISTPERGPRWLVAYLVLLGLAGILQPYLQTETSLPPRLTDLFFVANIGGVSTMVFILLYYFVMEKDKAYRLLHLEQEKSENLLLNVLPKEIAPILKNETRTIADKYDSASVLFADVVGFTPLSAELAPTEMVELLNEIFSYFDSLVEKYGLEKIRTIGDNYMVAAGVPRPRQDQSRSLVHLRQFHHPNQPWRSDFLNCQRVFLLGLDRRHHEADLITSLVELATLAHSPTDELKGRHRDGMIPIRKSDILVQSAQKPSRARWMVEAHRHPGFGSTPPVGCDELHLSDPGCVDIVRGWRGYPSTRALTARKRKGLYSQEHEEHSVHSDAFRRFGSSQQRIRKTRSRLVASAPFNLRTGDHLWSTVPAEATCQMLLPQERMK